MIDFSEFEKNLSFVRDRISRACVASGRKPSEVGLLAVTKNHPVDAVDYASRCGLTSVGENRVQEASDKRAAYHGALRWELIGHLQSNKAALAVATFDRIQTVDSLKLLRRLDRFAGEGGKALPILLQCNSGEDPNKYGFAMGEGEAVLEAALGLEHLQVEGLMTIAPLADDPDVARVAFERLRDLRDQLSERFGVSLSELSMGMTDDLEAAIAAGSTQIRVGTALYGSRALFFDGEVN
ncbi:MAG: YggS family pyridoxal phosphate-dependent enzyme [Puniceicoccaceae bacterium]|nr:MAG: YggS family pyridoxal phosphate-dependent enzyme [Puniceicoccaceae bacterium]